MNQPVNEILIGDALTRLKELPDESVNCCVTSPPYWGLRDYGVAGQIGLESTPYEYVEIMVGIFDEVRRVLRDDGTLWLNLGDSYATGAGSARSPGGKCFGKQNEAVDAGSFPRSQPNRMPIAGLKPKDLIGIPWRVAFALQAAGWWLRSDIIWAKPNCMPESVQDRPTRSHEYIFLLSKSERYYYDAAAIREPFQTDPRENYPARAKITGRENQEAAAARGNDRGKTGGFPPRADKQRGHSRRHAGFNDRWDKMEREEQVANGRNKRDVWTISPQPFPEAHFATFPEALIVPCIMAGCPAGGVVLDPFMGAGTTALVSVKAGRQFIGIELNPAYAKIAMERIQPEISQPRLA